MRWPGTVHGFLRMAGELAAGRELVDYVATALTKAFGEDSS